MSGIQAVQGDTTINDGGTHALQNARGCVIKAEIECSMVDGASAYDWLLDQRPADSGAVIGDGSAATVTFTPDVPGHYVVRERVTGSELGLIVACGYVTPAEAEEIEYNLVSIPYDASAASVAGLVVTESTSADAAVTLASENDAVAPIGTVAVKGTDGQVAVAGLVSFRSVGTLTIAHGDALYVSGTAGKVSNVATNTVGHYVKRVGFARKSVSASADTVIEAVWSPAPPVVVT